MSGVPLPVMAALMRVPVHHMGDDFVMSPAQMNALIGALSTLPWGRQTFPDIDLPRATHA